MKLRNKKTGEIREVKNILIDEMFSVNSLAELNADWKDYEELPKGYWVVEPYGKVEYIKVDRHWSEDLYHQFKDFGNCFETKEEAEKVLEKLKAWKRLKDKGFKFEWWISKPEGNEIDFYLDEFEWSGQVKDDLDLLFGDENESNN